MMTKITAPIVLALFALPTAALADDGSCPNVCEAIAGDVNDDGQVNVSDQVALADFLFRGTRPEVCTLLADLNGDGDVDISDFIYLHQFLWQGGPAPVDSLMAGDVNADGYVDISDLFSLTSWYRHGRFEICEAAADVNGDCDLDITDVRRLGSYLYGNGRDLVLATCE